MVYKTSWERSPSLPISHLQLPCIAIEHFETIQATCTCMRITTLQPTAVCAIYTIHSTTWSLLALPGTFIWELTDRNLVRIRRRLVRGHTATCTKCVTPPSHTCGQSVLNLLGNSAGIVSACLAPFLVLCIHRLLLSCRPWSKCRTTHH